MGAGRARRRPVALDAGALIALESPRGRALLRAVADRDQAVVISAGAVGQVLRDPARQALLSRLLARSATTVVALDAAAARACGLLLARVGLDDVIDAHVMLSARQHDARVIVSGDAADLCRLDPGVRGSVI